MTLGRRQDERQEDLFVVRDQLPRSAGHVFYRRLNQLLAEIGFDRWIEQKCREHYDSQGLGRPSIPPGVYFRMLLVGYFEGIGSQRGIAWRCHDSLSLREFLGIPLTEDGGGPHALGAQSASIRCDNKLASCETFQGSRADAVAAQKPPPP